MFIYHCLTSKHSKHGAHHNRNWISTFSFSTVEALFKSLFCWSKKEAYPKMCMFYTVVYHSCQPMLGVNPSPELVNLHFPYACWGLLFFRWYQRHFEFQSACVAMEGRSNVVLNMHAQPQISLLRRFLNLLH